MKNYVFPIAICFSCFFSCFSMAGETSLRVQGDYTPEWSFVLYPSTLDMTISDKTVDVTMHTPAGLCAPHFEKGTWEKAYKSSVPFINPDTETYRLRMLPNCQTEDFFDFERRLVLSKNQAGEIIKVRITSPRYGQGQSWVDFSGTQIQQ